MGTSFRSCAMFCYVLLALIGVAAGANVICTDYGKDVGEGGGLDNYYQRELPGNCRGQHGNVANWKPTYRIQSPHSDCPGGWKKYKGACYVQNQPRNFNFRQHEEWCNQHNAHIFVANDREEYKWVEQNVMTHNGWYFTGTFCSDPPSGDPSNFFTATREDMRVINKKLNVRMHPGQKCDNHNLPCAMSHRNNPEWTWKWHQQHCHEGNGVICEAPLG